MPGCGTSLRSENDQIDPSLIRLDLESAQQNLKTAQQNLRTAQQKYITFRKRNKDQKRKGGGQSECCSTNDVHNPRHRPVSDSSWQLPRTLWLRMFGGSLPFQMMLRAF